MLMATILDERIGRVAGILEKIGFGAERIRMYNLSAGEGAAFARFTGEFVEQVQALGPSPINLVRSQQNKERVEEVSAT